MKNFFKNYKSSLLLLGAILIGGVVGAILGPKATILKPFGDLFLNLLFMSLVPLVFFSVSSAIANMSTMKRLGKIMVNIVQHARPPCPSPTPGVHSDSGLSSQ